VRCRPAVGLGVVVASAALPPPPRHAHPYRRHQHGWPVTLQVVRAPAARTPDVRSWRLGDLSVARARVHFAVREGIGSFDALRIPQDLKTGHQLDITRRSAGGRHAGANGLVGDRVFGPILLERVLCISLVGKTGLFVAPENNAPAPGRFTARPDLKRGRTAASSPPSLSFRLRCRVGRLRWSSRTLLVLADVGREIVYDGRPPSIEAARLRELKALKIGRASFYRVQGPPPGQGGVGRFTPGRRPGPIGAMPCDRQLSILRYSPSGQAALWLKECPPYPCGRLRSDIGSQPRAPLAFVLRWPSSGGD
jgi:hypothetical protein